MKRSLIDVIKMLLNAGWRRRYLVCVPIVMMIPISILGARIAPRTFEAKTIILLQETGKDNPFLKDYVVGLNVKDRISALQALLKSEHVLHKVLMDISGADVERDKQKLAWSIRDLSARISVQLIGGDLLELKLKSNQSAGMGKILEAVTARFLERLLSPEQSTIASTQEFLDRQREMRRQVLDVAERALSEFKSRHADKLSGIYAANIQRLTAIKQKFEERSLELEAARASIKEMKRQLASTNPIIGRLEDSMVQLTAELTALRSRYTAEHSEVQAAERKLQRLQEERLNYLEEARKVSELDVDRLWNMAAGRSETSDKSLPPLLVSQMIRLQEAMARESSLRNEVEQLKTVIVEIQARMADHAPIDQQVQRLEKEMASARESYEAVLKRYDNATVSRALGIFEFPERVKIIDAPQDPAVPVTPPKVIFFILGILAGVGLGISLATVAELLDQNVRTADDLELLTKLPVIARLPKLIALDPDSSVNRAATLPPDRNAILSPG